MNNYCQTVQRTRAVFTEVLGFSLQTIQKFIQGGTCFSQKRWSCEYQHCRCLTIITIALNRFSVFRQIQYTIP